jgi:hypothetical protein
MRYFTAPPELFDALRAQVMQTLGQPNGSADQPWDAGLTSLALAPHEYTPPQYVAMIDYALANGATEITDAEYQAMQPLSDFDLADE